MRYLGIDFGTKRVGIAISDEGGSLAFPHSVMENNKNLIEKVLDIIKKESIEKVIMGESKNFKGEDNEIMKDILKFKGELENKTGREVIFEPEFLTSAEAQQIQGRNGMIDASAAAVILQSYLDKLDNSRS